MNNPRILLTFHNGNIISALADGDVQVIVRNADDLQAKPVHLPVATVSRPELSETLQLGETVFA